MMKHGSALRASGQRQQRRVRTIRHCRILVSVVLAGLSIPAAFGRGDAAADTLHGPARVVDADTIDVAGERVRLSGIDALERNQRCRDDAGRSYRCGAEAAAALKRRIGGGPCAVKRPSTTDTGGRSRSVSRRTARI